MSHTLMDGQRMYSRIKLYTIVTIEYSYSRRTLNGSPVSVAIMRVTWTLSDRYDPV